MITIADVLRAVKYIPETNNGICTQKLVGLWLNPEQYTLLKDTMSKWPKRSDCHVYPVPVSENERAAYLAHMKYAQDRMNDVSLWDADTEYGRLRYELLDWLIAHPDLQKPLWKRGWKI